MRDLSMKGRILLSKTVCLSCLVYPVISLEVPYNINKEVDLSTSNTILKNRRIKHYFQYKNTIW